MRGRGRAKAAARVPVMARKDSIPCGLFLLCFACHMVKNGARWRESSSEAVFCIDDMCNWLERMKMPNEHVGFTMAQLRRSLYTRNLIKCVKVNNMPREAYGYKFWLPHHF